MGGFIRRNEMVNALWIDSSERDSFSDGSAVIRFGVFGMESLDPSGIASQVGMFHATNNPAPSTTRDIAAKRRLSVFQEMRLISRPMDTEMIVCKTRRSL